MFTITGVASFDYFASIGVWFLIISLPFMLSISLLAKKLIK